MKMETRIRNEAPMNAIINSSTHSLIGRVENLLEVGTGFHPMPSGHENIHVNGAIQRMSKREIAEVLAVGDFLQVFVSQHK
jgi:ABC-type polysaccharide/polyol phosphate transport system ATPase subunit